MEDLRCEMRTADRCGPLSGVAEGAPVATPGWSGRLARAAPYRRPRSIASAAARKTSG